MAFSTGNRNTNNLRRSIFIKFALTFLVCISSLPGLAREVADYGNSNLNICDAEEQEELTIGKAHPGIANLCNHGLVSASRESRYPLDLGLEEDNQLRDMFHRKIQSNEGEIAVVNVESFGAQGDGITDDTQAFMNAWQMACSLSNSVFLVPEGYVYLVKPITFTGPCNCSMIVQIAGTVVAPNDPTTWDPQNPRTWLVFSRLNGVTIQGEGVIDGSGQKWWAQSCKTNRSNPCRSAPTAFTVDLSWNVIIKDLNFQNSQQIHIVISRSIGVQVTDLLVVAPGDSPNTDGIHITRSQDVVINGCKIATGDDCISIVSGSANVKVGDVLCGPGHGISVGSLGKDSSEAYVAAIVVDGATLTGTTNGLRIKTWQGGSGFAQGIRFQNIVMRDVSNPIIIDQFYCDAKDCKNQTSAVRVSEVVFMNVMGTSHTREAIKFACSDTVPCNNIILDNVNLQRADTGNPADSFCSSAAGFRVGSVNPDADCLQFLDVQGPDKYCLETKSLEHTGVNFFRQLPLSRDTI